MTSMRWPGLTTAATSCCPAPTTASARCLRPRRTQTPRLAAPPRPAPPHTVLPDRCIRIAAVAVHICAAMDVAPLS